MTAKRLLRNANCSQSNEAAGNSQMKFSRKLQIQIDANTGEFLKRVLWPILFLSDKMDLKRSG